VARRSPAQTGGEGRAGQAHIVAERLDAEREHPVRMAHAVERVEDRGGGDFFESAIASMAMFAPAMLIIVDE
jgi:hypothetical protein